MEQVIKQLKMLKADYTDFFTNESDSLKKRKWLARIEGINQSIKLVEQELEQLNTLA